MGGNYMKKRLFMAAAVIAAVTVPLTFTGCEKKTANGEQSTLTYWTPLQSNASMIVSNFGETALAQELEKRTGVKVEYQHPPQGQETEKFNILIASDDFPDIIEYNWLKYPGGPQKAINDGIIVDLNDYESKIKNLSSYLDANEEVRKLAVTDSGALFSFPFIRGDESLLTSAGIVIRQDWLDELGLDMPETIAEWEHVLTEFKNKKSASAPLTLTVSDFSNGLFVGAYDTTVGYYLDDGKVKYGMLEPGFKDFLTLMNRWYQDGLFDNNFGTLDSTTRDSNILNDISGATYGSIGRGIGKWMEVATDKSGYQLEGAPMPVLNKGDTPEFGHYQLPIFSSNTAFVAVTRDSNNVALAMEYLDYGYSEEGCMLYNFGIEGESYEMIDGYPTYTDIITNNPNGLSMTVAMSNYTCSYDAGPFIQDKRYMEQYGSMPEQKRAWGTWTATNAKEHALPHLYVQEDELNELANLSNSIDTYASEMILKFIIGTEPLDNYDNAVAQLKTRGIDRVLEMKQAAYERYLTK